MPTTIAVHVLQEELKPDPVVHKSCEQWLDMLSVIVDVDIKFIDEVAVILVTEDELFTSVIDVVEIIDVELDVIIIV